MLQSQQSDLIGRLLVYSGNHGYHVIKRYNKKFPQNANFQVLRCRILIVKGTPENYRNLFAIGTFENTVHQHSMKTPFAEICLRMRQQFLLLKAECSEEKSWKKLSGNLCRKMAASLEVGPGEMGLTWLVASSTQPVWDLLEKILRGQTAHDNPLSCRPRSSHHLNSMSRIPEEHLIEWLTLVVQGQDQLKQFKHRCQVWKAETKVWDSLVEVAVEHVLPPVAITDPSEIAHFRDSLEPAEIREELARTYPGIVQQIRDYASSVAGTALKHIPTPHATAQFRRYLQNQQKILKNERKTKVNSIFLSFFQIILF
jgi:hypothetical protein